MINEISFKISDDGTAHGVFLMNSNALSFTFTESESKGNSIGIQSTGGIFDIYVFSGPNPAEVVSQVDNNDYHLQLRYNDSLYFCKNSH